jgi:hypothetical protein
MMEIGRCGEILIGLGSHKMLSIARFRNIVITDYTFWKTLDI